LRSLLAASLACAVLVGAPGCLVLSLHPAYDNDWIAWDPAFVGQWKDSDDNATLRVEAAEWRSYKLHYEHPSEKGDLTGYLTIVGDDRYLDVMPVRGEDRGSFVIPVHMIMKLTIEGETLTLAPLSYDALADRLRAGRGAPPGLSAVMDQKQNVLITSATARLRSWLRTTSAGSVFWGAAATFTRQPSPDTVRRPST